MPAPEPLFVKPTFYVREDATLVLCSVGRRVGGPGGGMWRGCWLLPRGSDFCAPWEPADLPMLLMQEFVTNEGLRPMGGTAASAYMRSWTVKG